MSTPDDTTDPLAGIDLHAWQPPAPPTGQVNAILASVRNTTRTDVASAVEVVAVPPAKHATRKPWVAIGIVVAAAAAAVIAVVTWLPSAPRRPEPPAPATVKIETDDGSTAGAAAATVRDPATCERAKPGASCAGCHPLVHPDAQHRDGRYAASECAGCHTQSVSGAVGSGAGSGSGEAVAKLALHFLTEAAGNKDYAGVVAAFRKVPADSIYAEQARAIHDRVRDQFVQDELAKAKAAARRLDCKEVKTRARHVASLWPEAAHVLRDVDCGGEAAATTPRSGSSDCDAAALIEEAQTAYRGNQWARVFTKAEASNKCAPTKTAREFALFAACRMGSVNKAKRYWREFENDSAMRQACYAVMK
jgi:hypothetical protein